jgi:hypothetical protein
MDKIKKSTLSNTLHSFGQKHPTSGDKSLASAAIFWFIIAFIGHLIFVLYIAALYGVSLFEGDFERWNAMMPNGYTEGDIAGNISISIHLLLAAVIAIRYAMARNFTVHRKWALRLFMVVSGVWFFRVGFMLWMLIHQKPVGFDPVTFQGPFLTFLSFAQYLLPLLFLEIYFWAQERAGQTGKIGIAALIALLTIAMGIGIFGASMGMWLPNIY